MSGTLGALERRRGLAEKLASAPWGLFGITAAIGMTGAALLYSGSGGSWEPWASRHATRLVVFGLGAIAVGMVDPRWWRKIAWPAYWGCVGLLLMVALLGEVGMGARRWLDLGVMRLQPSELAKVGTILALARLFHDVRWEERSGVWTVLRAGLVVAAPFMLTLRQPDLGTALLLLTGSASVAVLAGVSWRYGAVCAGLLTAAVPLGWLMMHDYQKRRVLTFLNPEKDLSGAGYHITQSKIAFGSGGVSGRGFLEGTQGKLDFLPETRTDFIFSVMGEEFGLIGSAGLLGLYVTATALGYVVAFRCRHDFGRLLAGGLATMLMAHVVVNMGMVTGLAPVVGAPLPLTSYGGSSMLAFMWGLGLMMSVKAHDHVESLGRLEGLRFVLSEGLCEAMSGAHSSVGRAADS